LSFQPSYRLRSPRCPCGWMNLPKSRRRRCRRGDPADGGLLEVEVLTLKRPADEATLATEPATASTRKPTSPGFWTAFWMTISAASTSMVFSRTSKTRYWLRPEAGRLVLYSYQTDRKPLTAISSYQGFAAAAAEPAGAGVGPRAGGASSARAAPEAKKGRGRRRFGSGGFSSDSPGAAHKPCRGAPSVRGPLKPLPGRHLQGYPDGRATDC